MSNQDPISDMLTRIRNAQQRTRDSVIVVASRHIADILRVLDEEGFIAGFEPINERQIQVGLKYMNNKPVIEMIQRASRPGVRLYKKHDEIPRIKGGLGIAVMTTSHGVMSDKKARALGQGGEVLCYVA